MKRFIIALSLTMIVGMAYAEKFAGGIDLGYGSVSAQYDSTGKVIKPQDSSLSILNFGLGGKYYILSPEMGPKVYVGGKFKFSNYTESRGDSSSSSGFSPQYLSLFLGGSLVFLNAKAGFQIDLGPKEKDTNKLFNSDRQNAIFLGFGANVPFANMLGDFHANLDYVLTLERTENNVKSDVGDFLFITLGGGYKFALSELASFGIGLDVIYRSRTDTTLAGQTKKNSGGNNLSIMPYASYKTGPISIWLKLGATDEYGYYGFSIMGKNDPVTRLSFTAGVNFSY